MYRLIDTHAHLEEIENLEQTLAEARSANVMAIIAVGSDYKSNRKVLDFAQTYEGFIYSALGLHPGELRASEIDRNLHFLESHIDRAVAVGEIGLDYHKRIRAVADKDLQKYALKEVLRIAREHEKPVIIHSRYAWRDSFTLLEEMQLEKAVFHWYTGTSSVLRDILDRHYFISATPAVEYHEEHKRAVKGTPLERLLLETDSPVVYGRGSEFEYKSRPANVARSLKGVARVKRISEAQIAEATTSNAIEFFGLNMRTSGGPAPERADA